MFHKEESSVSGCHFGGELINLISEFWFKDATVVLLREPSFLLITRNYTARQPKKKTRAASLYFYSNKVFLGTSEKSEKENANQL